MRICLLLLTGIAVLLFSCASSKRATEIDLSGHWELTFFPAGGKSFAEMFGERRPTLQFDNLRNMVSGSTGCNQFNAAINRHQSQISFQNMVTTRMACPGYEESYFLNALARVNHFVLQGHELRLLEDATLLMAFVKK